ncbi:MAG: tryptophan--tRNA ligase, partial [Dehalococcoidales bacterium]|nr:tryptophan--tRNA ligase [Dehalococcoidales bacterium]
MNKRVFSGIQPTGNIHIGNYLGAIKYWVSMQENYDNIFCIVDLHAITVPQDPGVLKAKIREVSGLLMAAGIDPERSIVFVQSHVSAHSELAWILNCFLPMGWMQRMTQFKEKSQKQKEQVSVGLFDYPALMAADILLYGTDVVPVGEDQKQHVELARDAAQRFNSIFGKTFVVPKPLIPDVGARIMGLDDPTNKMSKSEAGSIHAINLLDSPDVIRSKIMKATTDSLRDILFDESRPGIYNLLSIYQSFTGEDNKEIEARFAGKGYGDFKKALAEVVVEGLRPVQERYNELTAEAGLIDSILKAGAEKARPLADKMLAEVQK